MRKKDTSGLQMISPRTPETQQGCRAQQVTRISLTLADVSSFFRRLGYKQETPDLFCLNIRKIFVSKYLHMKKSRIDCWFSWQLQTTAQNSGPGTLTHHMLGGSHEKILPGYEVCGCPRLCIYSSNAQYHTSLFL